LDRYSELRARAVEFVREFSAGGAVQVLAPVRTAAEEIARLACGNALVGVRAAGFRDLVTELAAPELNRRELIPVGRFVREALAARVTAEAIARQEFTGVVNLASPNPLPNRDFMRGLREAWGVPFGLPVQGWSVEIGAFLMRTESELILKSRRVVPGRLLDAGFQFLFPEWPAAARELASRWRQGATDSRRHAWGAF